MCDNRNIFKKKTILELGAGTGICGIVAGKIGANVLISEMSSNKSALDVIRTNLSTNNVTADILPLEWGVLEDLFHMPKLDFIIGSDVFYDEDDFEDLFFTLSLLLENQTTFYTAYHHRCAMSVECYMKKWDLSSQLVLYDSCSDIHLYKINKKL